MARNNHFVQTSTHSVELNGFNEIRLQYDLCRRPLLEDSELSHTVASC